MKIRKITTLLILSICFLLSNSTSGAIQAGGKISGKITDAATGEAIPGVNVTVVGTTTGAATDINGEYFILNLSPGKYSLRASIIGYKPVVQTNVEVNLNHTTNVDFKLEETVLEFSEDVVITATRPLIEKDQTASRHFVSAEEIQVRPVNDFSSLLSSLPGIEQSATGELTVRRGSIDQVAFLIDGMRASNPLDYEPYTNINLSSIRELEIITGAFNAEYGQAQSGVFNIVTKEGSKNLEVFTEARWMPARKPHWGTAFYDYSTTRYWENTHARHLQWWIDNPHQWVDNQGIPGNDPNAGMTPEEAYNYYMQTHQPLTDYTNQSGYSAEIAIGGPLLLSEDLFFFLSGKYRTSPPVTGNSFRDAGEWFDGTFKLTYNINPSLKIMGSGFAGIENSDFGAEYMNNDFINSYGIESKYAYYDFPGYPESRTNGQTLQMTHVINPSTFYQVQLSRIFRFRSQSTFPGDETGWETGVPVVDNLRAYDEFGGEIPGGFSNLVGLHTSGYYYRGEDNNTDISLSGDITSQINFQWQLKAGGDFTYYTLDRFQQAKSYLAIEEAKYNPYEGNVYLQSKIEFREGLIINAGLRYDFYNPNDEAFDDIFDPFGTFGKAPGEPATPNTSPTKLFGQLSPRLGISHPISELTVLHFSYGHFFQRANFGDYGEGQEVLGILNTYLIKEAGGTYLPYNLGNRNLEPRKTVSFELGIEHNIAGIVADVTAYYKDITNTVRTITVLTYEGARYYTSGNGDYGDSKGVEISLRKPLTGIWGGYLNYTYTSGINGRSGDPVFLAPPGLSQQGQVTFTGDELVYDRPRLKFGVTLVTPSDLDIFAGIFKNMQFALDYQIYYPNKNISNDVFAESGKQFQRSGDKNADLRIRKEFRLWNVLPAVFLEVRNLFNDRWTNIDLVKSSPPEDRVRFINSGFESFPETLDNGAPFPDQLEYRNLPRQIALGIEIRY